MRPFLVTEAQAGKLPRWGVLLLTLLYVIPGFVGRDPWRHDDAAGFGVALTMARGTAQDWLVPNIAGVAVPEEGPFPFWFAALLARLLPVVSEHAATRVAAASGIVLLLVGFWYATYELLKRPGLMPSDPFGAAASRIDFGRAIADCALLILMATLGVIARLHETTTQAAQLMLYALFLYGVAIALRRPLVGGLIAGLMIGASVATRGLLPAGMMLVCVSLLPLVSAPYRLGATRWITASVLVALCTGTAWPIALANAGPAAQAHLTAWLAWNAAQLSGIGKDGLLYLARTLPWYFWPAWPMAIWAVLRWRGRLGEPAVALPLLSLATAGIAALLTIESREKDLLSLSLPLAMLAAVGLPTLARSLISLIDWFSVMTFSVIGFAVWAYWGALLTGFPPKMARSAERIAPGFDPGPIMFDLALGLAATVAWVMLVRWRVSRQPPMIWRAVVLSSSGLVLAWFLLMTLWLPAFNARNTYRQIAVAVATKLPERYDCIEAPDLGRAQRATLYYFAHLRFGEAGRQCDWMLRQDTGPLARTKAAGEPGWKLIWDGSRPRDDDERLRLLRRTTKR